MCVFSVNRWYFVTFLCEKPISIFLKEHIKAYIFQLNPLHLLFTSKCCCFFPLGLVQFWWDADLLAFCAIGILPTCLACTRIIIVSCSLLFLIHLNSIWICVVSCVHPAGWLASIHMAACFAWPKKKVYYVQTFHTLLCLSCLQAPLIATISNHF